MISKLISAHKNAYVEHPNWTSLWASEVMPINFSRCSAIWPSLSVGQYSIQVSSPKWYLNLRWLRRARTFFIRSIHAHNSSENNISIQNANASLSNVSKLKYQSPHKSNRHHPPNVILSANLWKGFGLAHDQVRLAFFKFQKVSTVRMSQERPHIPFRIWISAWKQTHTHKPYEDKASAMETVWPAMIRSHEIIFHVQFFTGTVNQKETGKPYLPSALAQPSCYRCLRAVRSSFPTTWFYKLQDKHL